MFLLTRPDSGQKRYPEIGHSQDPCDKELCTMDQVYADDIGTITVTGPVIRFDLLIQSATEKDGAGKPKLVAQQRVIMPIDAFLRAAQRMQGSVQELVQKGVITRAPKGTAPPPKDQAGSTAKK